MPQTSNSPHPVDRLVGANIRRLRHRCGLSQGALAEALGVTFQQVQKYENASNRIAPSRLAAVAARLDVGIMALFEGLDLPERIPDDGPKRAAYRALHVIQAPEFVEAATQSLKLFRDLDIERRRPAPIAAE